MICLTSSTSPPPSPSTSILQPPYSHPHPHPHPHLHLHLRHWYGHCSGHAVCVLSVFLSTAVALSRALVQVPQSGSSRSKCGRTSPRQSPLNQTYAVAAGSWSNPHFDPASQNVPSRVFLMSVSVSARFADEIREDPAVSPSCCSPPTAAASWAHAAAVLTDAASGSCFKVGVISRTSTHRLASHPISSGQSSASFLGRSRTFQREARHVCHAMPVMPVHATPLPAPTLPCCCVRACGRCGRCARRRCARCPFSARWTRQSSPHSTCFWYRKVGRKVPAATCRRRRPTRHLHQTRAHLDYQPTGTAAVSRGRAAAQARAYASSPCGCRALILNLRRANTACNTVQGLHGMCAI